MPSLTIMKLRHRDILKTDNAHKAKKSEISSWAKSDSLINHEICQLEESQ
jgi:hypothetical protein